MIGVRVRDEQRRRLEHVDPLAPVFATVDHDAGVPVMDQQSAVTAVSP